MLRRLYIILTLSWCSQEHFKMKPTKSFTEKLFYLIQNVLLSLWYTDWQDLTTLRMMASSHWPIWLPGFRNMPFEWQECQHSACHSSANDISRVSPSHEEPDQENTQKNWPIKFLFWTKIGDEQRSVGRRIVVKRTLAPFLKILLAAFHENYGTAPWKHQDNLVQYPFLRVERRYI